MFFILLAPTFLWAWFVWRNPTRAFIWLPVLLPAYVIRFSVGPMPTTALEMVVIGLAAGWVCARRQDGIRAAWNAMRPWRIPVGLWLLAGMGGVVTAWAQGFDIVAALGLFRAYFIEPLVVFAIGLDVIRTPQHRMQLFRSFGIVAGVLALWSVVQFITGWGIPHPWNVWPDRRATGPFPFPNALGLFLAPIAAFAVAWLVATPPLFGRMLPSVWVRVCVAAVLVAALVGTVLAESDGGIVAILAAAVAALLLRPQTRRATLAAGVVAMAIFLLSAFGGPLQGAHDRIRDMVLFQEWSGKVRTVIWKETAMLLKDHPFFGAGLAAYPAAILPYHTATWMEVFQYPHNHILNIWSEVGVLGLVAFAAMMMYWVLLAERRDIAIPVILAILVHGLVDVPYFKNDLAIAFWLLVLLTTSGEVKARLEPV